MKADIFLAASDNGVARTVRAANGDWTVTTLAKEHKVTCLANSVALRGGTDPAGPRRVYAGTVDGVLCSDDEGLTWQPSGLRGQIVKSLAVSPNDPNVVYAGTKPAWMFKSIDGGRTWSELEGFRRIPNRWWWFSPAEPPDRRPYVFALTVSPTEPDVVLAGVEFGAVVRSEDGGETWSRHLRGALRDCHSLKFHLTDGAWAYEAGGTGGGASFSRDGGRSWQKAKNGLAKNYGIVCAADAVKPEIWYVSVAPSPFNAFGKDPQIYLYRSTGGAGWQPIGWQAHPLPTAPTALATVPGAAGHLFAGLYNGDVWHTSDYGDSWEQLPFNLGGIWFAFLVLGGEKTGGAEG